MATPSKEMNHMTYADTTSTFHSKRFPEAAKKLEVTKLESSRNIATRATLDTVMWSRVDRMDIAGGTVGNVETIRGVIV